jgi:hypothetical protein
LRILNLEEVETMPKLTFRRWTADDIAKLQTLAQKRRRADCSAPWSIRFGDRKQGASAEPVVKDASQLR